MGPLDEFGGRLVVRPDGPKAKNNLLIGTGLKDFLKEGEVYNISKCPLTNEIKLTPVGQSAVKRSMPDYTMELGYRMMTTWCHGIHDVMSVAGKYLFYTETEYLQACKEYHESTQRSCE